MAEEELVKVSSDIYDFNMCVEEEKLDFDYTFNYLNPGVTGKIKQVILGGKLPMDFIATFVYSENHVRVKALNFIQNVRQKERRGMLETLNELNAKYMHMRYLLVESVVEAHMFVERDNKYSGNLVLHVMKSMEHAINEDYVKILEAIICINE